ncbi:hypothetical protein BC938DRAFT_473275 [Jimgerdemannia flammicorona]|uniref:Uncharacterized protein n=1 Tax=Jimgerdemannia flammicorona TaxID=994334 RepID=A0A433Q4C0_9FUNG|nr:hypothetical protein BC938DRAFT_473275 [Jimgerdemannia flammicorona]
MLSMVMDLLGPFTQPTCEKLCMHVTSLAKASSGTLHLDVGNLISSQSVFPPFHSRRTNTHPLCTPLLTTQPHPHPHQNPFNEKNLTTTMPSDLTNGAKPDFTTTENGVVHEGLNVKEYLPKGTDEAVRRAMQTGKEIGQSATEIGLHAWSLVSTYTTEYPLLGIFLALLAAFSFIPIASFLIFIVVSLLFVAGGAIIATVVVEGILVSIAGTFLLFALFLAISTATFILGWLAFFVYGFRAVNLALDHLNTWQQQQERGVDAAKRAPVPRPEAGKVEESVKEE